LRSQEGMKEMGLLLPDSRSEPVGEQEWELRMSREGRYQTGKAHKVTKTTSLFSKVKLPMEVRIKRGKNDLTTLVGGKEYIGHPLLTRKR